MGRTRTRNGHGHGHGHGHGTRARATGHGHGHGHGHGRVSPINQAPQASSPGKGYLAVDYVGGQDSFGYGIFTSPADPPSLTAARNTVGAFLNASLNQ